MRFLIARELGGGLKTYFDLNDMNYGDFYRLYFYAMGMKAIDEKVLVDCFHVDKMEKWDQYKFFQSIRRRISFLMGKDVDDPKRKSLEDRCNRLNLMILSGRRRNG